ncbi:MAG: SMI1/KNR4 family protein [Actinomycetaceae bacterium]|nr:SMI1/KNR4 family protein [Actinomycetaceae bacterium]
MTAKFRECASPVERIRRKLGVARLADYLREVFGADSHNYVLGEPIAIERIRKFEADHKVTLPEEYVVFLTEIGHPQFAVSEGSEEDIGDAGPKYGLFPLDTGYQWGMLTDRNCLHETSCIGVVSDEEWQELFAPLDACDDDEWESLRRKSHYGILPVVYGGGSDFYGLIVTGTARGAIISSNTDCYDIPTAPNIIGNDFLSWYEEWLDGILDGGVVKSWMQPRLDQDEVFRRLSEYAEQGTIATHSSLAHRMAGGIENLDPENRDSLWHWYREANDERSREWLLALLAQFDYENAKTEIEGACDGLFIHILATRAPEHINDWNDRLKEMESSGCQDLIDAAWFLRENADSLAASASATHSR